MLHKDNFELFKSNVCHRLKEMGDIPFIINILENGYIRDMFSSGMYKESLYLLAMLDYVSRINNVAICSDYDDLRRYKLSDILYPSGILISCEVSGDTEIKTAAVIEAIPEFARFNIVENEVRNVV